ncbi:hypothetical protein AVEN_107285-1 [Araneus ventricosus]|uniref:Uncharacterized protein n=1 Tax=Araneus ventricosus TaxID=182803 RepID=A0A4Y2DU89_ARAVE|nr:hypothetical protein AVEN_107285-1 [Araneus ventricosus]
MAAVVFRPYSVKNAFWSRSLEPTIGNSMRRHHVTRRISTLASDRTEPAFAKNRRDAKCCPYTFFGLRAICVDAGGARCYTPSIYQRSLFFCRTINGSAAQPVKQRNLLKVRRSDPTPSALLRKVQSGAKSAKTTRDKSPTKKKVTAFKEKKPKKSSKEAGGKKQTGRTKAAKSTKKKQ